MRRVLRAGASGIVLDGTVDVALVPTVNAVLAGQLAVPCALRSQIAPRPLSYREKQVLGLVVLGLTNREIADKLYLAESTVKTHLSSVFGKLDAHSRAEALRASSTPRAATGSASSPSAAARRQRSDDHARPQASAGGRAAVVVSPVYNEAGHIDRTARAMAAQERHPDRWVIVDDGSRDDTLEIARRWERDCPS